MADTLARTAWAVGVGRDAETLFADSRLHAAIGFAIANYLERADCDGYDPEPEVEIEVYQGAEWCTGPTPETDGDCYCGGGHDGYGDGHWLLIAWERRTRQIEATE